MNQLTNEVRVKGMAKPKIAVMTVGHGKRHHPLCHVLPSHSNLIISRPHRGMQVTIAPRAAASGAQRLGPCSNNQSYDRCRGPRVHMSIDNLRDFALLALLHCAAHLHSTDTRPGPCICSRAGIVQEQVGSEPTMTSWSVFAKVPKMSRNVAS